MHSVPTETKILKRDVQQQRGTDRPGIIEGQSELTAELLAAHSLRKIHVSATSTVYGIGEPEVEATLPIPCVLDVEDCQDCRRPVTLRKTGEVGEVSHRLQYPVLQGTQCIGRYANLYHRSEQSLRLSHKYR